MININNLPIILTYLLILLFTIFIIFCKELFFKNKKTKDTIKLNINDSFYGGKEEMLSIIEKAKNNNDIITSEIKKISQIFSDTNKQKTQKFYENRINYFAKESTDKRENKINEEQSNANVHYLIQKAKNKKEVAEYIEIFKKNQLEPLLRNNSNNMNKEVSNENVIQDIEIL